MALIAKGTRDTPETLPPVDPNPDSLYKLVALGDSYISGEGAEDFFPGTATLGKRRNTCHRAATAYPYLVAEHLEASLTFIACSGALTKDVTGVDASGKAVPGQHPRSPAEVIGGRPQVTELREVAEPDAVLSSIGGNDAGFAEIGFDCELRDCRRLAAHWLDRLETDVYPALVRTYTAVREAAHGAPVFAVDYPNPFGPEFCNDLVGLRPAETRFLGEVFIGRLNEIVEAAAAVAGVRVIDISGALAGYRFCEKPLGKTAVNFLHVDGASGVPTDIAELSGLASGTFHPNRIGHSLIEPIVLGRLEALRAGELGPAPQPQADNGPPPFLPDELGLPGRPLGFPPGTACGGHGAQLTAITQVSVEPGGEVVPLTGLAPDSTVCFRTYRADWESKRATAAGGAEVPVDVSQPGVASINEILVEDPGGAWKKIVVSRAGG